MKRKYIVWYILMFVPMIAMFTTVPKFFIGTGLAIGPDNEHDGMVCVVTCLIQLMYAIGYMYLFKIGVLPLTL